MSEGRDRRLVASVRRWRGSPSSGGPDYLVVGRGERLDPCRRGLWLRSRCESAARDARVGVGCAYSGRGLARRFGRGHGRWQSGPGGGRGSADSWLEVGAELLRFGCVIAVNGSTVVGELALRPGFSPQARVPPTARCASRGGRPGLLVLTAGLACRSAGVTPPARWPRPNPVERAGGSRPLPLRVVSTEGWEGWKTVTRTEQDRAARRRGELARDRGSRRVSSAIDAQRRLHARRERGTPTKADPVGPSDPRYAYLTRTYD